MSAVQHRPVNRFRIWRSQCRALPHPENTFPSNTSRTLVSKGSPLMESLQCRPSSPSNNRCAPFRRSHLAVRAASSLCVSDQLVGPVPALTLPRPIVDSLQGTSTRILEFNTRRTGIDDRNTFNLILLTGTFVDVAAHDETGSRLFDKGSYRRTAHMLTIAQCIQTAEWRRVRDEDEVPAGTG